MSTMQQDKQTPDGDAVFDLNAMIREELEGPVADPAVVAAQVEKRIPDDLLRDVVRALLSYRVSEVSRSRRTKVVDDLSDSPDTRATRSGSFGVSRRPRWAEAGDLYMKLLTQREALPGGEWKFLGDMTADEVLAAAATRINHGKASISRGRAYEALSKKMVQVGAKTVADLTHAHLDEVFAPNGKAAA
jgi:hypothetical protein